MTNIIYFTAPLFFIIFTILNLHKKKYTGLSFIEEFDEINEARQYLVDYTKKYLTTEHSAKKIIETANKFYS